MCMDKLERAHRLHKLFKELRTPVSMYEIRRLFEDCSESTAKRTIRDMKNLGAPIYCTDGEGYRYDRHIAFELPGIWFTPEELYALLSIDQLTAHLSGGLFDESIDLIRRKTETLLGDHMPSPGEMRRIRVLGSGSRSKVLPMFSSVTSGILERRRLQLVYRGRQRGEITAREVSPQRLVHYKGNWYLDCWCHRAEGLRSFAVERIEQVQLLDSICKTMPDDELDRLLSRSFGIFSGMPTAIAVLHFTAKAARWVQDEEWFPDQESLWLDDGSFELCIPYANPTELIMEICRYGPDVEVIKPPELRTQVAQRLLQATDQYR